METQNLSPEESQITLMPFGEIFNKIWTSPTEVFYNVVHRKDDKNLIFLLPLFGVVNALDNFSDNDLDQRTLMNFIIAIVIGLLLGYISAWVSAYVLKWAGELIGGRASGSSIVQVLAYAYIPAICSLIPLFFGISIYGFQGYTLTTDDDLSGVNMDLIVSTLIDVVEIILFIWSIVLIVKGLAIAQKFSIWKSVLNLLIPVVIVMFIAMTAFILVDAGT